MPEKIKHKNWISAYIYFKGTIYTYECDRIIIEILYPFLENSFVKGIYEKYFFIRYSEMGNHVRLRFYGDIDKLESTIIPAFEKFIQEFQHQEYLDIPLSSGNDSVSHHKHESVIWVKYEPEIERYGGETGVQIAEEYFFTSSKVSIKLLQQIKMGDNSLRLGIGMLCMLVLLHVFLEDKDETINLCSHYGQGYLTALSQYEGFEEAFVEGYEKQADTLINNINMIWDALEEEMNISEDIDEYREELYAIKRKVKEAVDKEKLYTRGTRISTMELFNSYIIPSYVHMMNNRMGISIKEEIYLSHIISKALTVNTTESKEKVND